MRSRYKSPVSIDKTNRIHASFLAQQDRQSVAYATSVMQGLKQVYGQATLTGDTILNLILGRTTFPRNYALSLVTQSNMYLELLRRGYTVNLYWELPDHALEGLTLTMAVPQSNEGKALEKLEELNHYAKGK